MRISRRAAAWLNARPRLSLLFALEVAGALAYAHFVSISGSGVFTAQAGIDYTGYISATGDWLTSGVFYEPWQVSGPYDIVLRGGPMAVLYPPYALVLFVPFAILPPLLSAILWWTAPMVAVIAVSLWHRPAPWSWPVLALLALNKWTFWLIVSGNPVMWSAAAVALGTAWRWPSPLALIKPTVAPFALVGICSRGWWITLGVGALIAAAFWPMWPDYLRATLNGRPVGLEYLWANVPIMLLPIVVGRAGRRLARGRGAAKCSGTRASRSRQPRAPSPPA